MSLKIKSQKDFEQCLVDAIQCHQQRQFQEAIDIYLALLDLVPESAFVHYNLAHAFSDIDRHSEAIKHYKLASSFSPDDTDILFNLGCSQKRKGLLDDAIKTYQQLLTLDENDIEAIYNLANCYKDLEQHTLAIDYYKKVLTCDQNHQPAINNLAFLYHKFGEDSEAIFYYKKVIELDPNNSSAQHMLSALKGETINEAPFDYVQAVFDNYSCHYEASLLNKLEYKVPQRIKAAFLEHFHSRTQFNCLLDLGCGSGLVAVQFKDFCDRIIGVDLSSKMLAIAKDKQIYDQLHCQDILAFLNNSSKIFDLIIAADVFTYIGELEPVFQQLHKVCLNNGIFIFSTENFDGEKYVLRKSGRFAHSKAYLEKVLLNTGWKLHTRFTTNLRREKDHWISGMIHLAIK